MNIRTFVTILSRNPQYDFPKMRGGVKGRLELFRKFISFGDAILPLIQMQHFTEIFARMLGGIHNQTIAQIPLSSSSPRVSQIIRISV